VRHRRTRAPVVHVVTGDAATRPAGSVHDRFGGSTVRETPEVSTMRNVERVTWTIVWQRGQLGVIELPETPWR
jgi:hypothetical protein